MNIQIKRLDKNARVSKAHDSDAGLDLIAVTAVPYKDFVEYGTGIAINIPNGHVGLLCPRSSISNKSMLLANCVGVIDSEYTGEIKVRMRRLNGEGGQYNIGDKVAQLVIMPLLDYRLVEVEEFFNVDKLGKSGKAFRGENGFGSSGA